MNAAYCLVVLECRDKTNEKSAADHLVSGVPSISGWQRPRQQTAGSEQLNIEHSAQIQVQSKVHQYKHALVLISVLRFPGMKECSRICQRCTRCVHLYTRGPLKGLNSEQSGLDGGLADKRQGLWWMGGHQPNVAGTRDPVHGKGPAVLLARPANAPLAQMEPDHCCTINCSAPYSRHRYHLLSVQRPASHHCLLAISWFVNAIVYLLAQNAIVHNRKFSLNISLLSLLQKSVPTTDG